jgi:hypothetical protein
MVLSEQQAFQVMIRFLDAYWERGGRPDAIGDLLGSLASGPFADGEPADPALWREWLDAIGGERLDAPNGPAGRVTIAWRTLNDGRAFDWRLEQEGSELLDDAQLQSLLGEVAARI